MRFRRAVVMASAILQMVGCTAMTDKTALAPASAPPQCVCTTTPLIPNTPHSITNCACGSMQCVVAMAAWSKVGDYGDAAIQCK